MAVQASRPIAHRSPQVIGNTFVEHYYNMLHLAPDQVHRFYKDSSTLSRPDSDGTMTSVTKIHDINEKLLSADFSNSIIEIETTDAQLSHKDGLLVVVIGSLTASDNIRRKFTQSFFLAPQENRGYFVLNDFFRFITEMQSVKVNQVALNQANDNTQNASIAPDPEPVPDEVCTVSDLPATEPDASNGGEVINPSVNDNCRNENNIIADKPIQLVEDESKEATQITPAPILAQKDMNKMSYASVVKAMREIPRPVQDVKPTVKVVESVENSVPVSAKPNQTTDTRPLTDSNVSKDNNLDEQGYSIYVRNLSLNTTAKVVEEVFKKFGTIKEGGIQVRIHKTCPYCIGFVEFESPKSMQAAIEASPISFDGRKAAVEKKRSTIRVVNGVVIYGATRDRLQLERGEPWGGANFKGGFAGIPSYSRNSFRNHNEYNYSVYAGGGGREIAPGSHYNQNGSSYPNTSKFDRLSGSRHQVVAA